jgi:hypothetical protein
VSEATCVNNCNELGKAARMEAQKLAKLTKLGSEMRVHLSKKGKQLKLEKKVSGRTADIWTAFVQAVC